MYVLAKHTHTQGTLDMNTTISTAFAACTQTMAATVMDVLNSNEAAKAALNDVVNDIAGRCPTSDVIEAGGVHYVLSTFASVEKLAEAFESFPDNMNAGCMSTDDVDAFKAIAMAVSYNIDYTDY